MEHVIGREPPVGHGPARQCELVDKLAGTPATSWEGVLVKLRYVFEYLDNTSDLGAEHSFQRDAIEAIERFAMPAAE